MGNSVWIVTKLWDPYDPETWCIDSVHSSEKMADKREGEIDEKFSPVVWEFEIDYVVEWDK